jgi:hypothetical protein
MPSDEMVEKALQPEVEDDNGSLCVMWHRSGKMYALTTKPDGSVVATVSPFSRSAPPVAVGVEALFAALTAAMGEEKPVAWRSRWTYPDVSSAWIITPHRPQDTTPRGHLATYVCEPLFAHPSREDVVEETIPDAAVEAFLLSFYPGMTVEEMAMHNGEDLRPGARTALAAAIRKLGERS